MKKETKWNFGLGSIFSLIVVYFIFLYSRDHGWTALAFITKWYLFIFGGIFILSIAIMILVMLATFILFIFAYFKMRSIGKSGKSRKKQEHQYLDVEYEVKE